MKNNNIISKCTEIDLSLFFEFEEPLIFTEYLEKNDLPPIFNSDKEIKEMGDHTRKIYAHINQHRIEYLESFKKRDPNYPGGCPQIIDQGDFTRSLDQIYKDCCRYNDSKNDNREIFQKAVSGSDMIEYKNKTERKSKSVLIGNKNIKQRKLANNRILIKPQPFMGNSSSKKVPRTALIYHINNKYGIITHMWECRISIPLEEWKSKDGIKARISSFKLCNDHFENPKYRFQQIIGGIKLYEYGRLFPGLICFPL